MIAWAVNPIDERRFREIVRANLYPPRQDEIVDPDRLGEIGIDFDNDMGGMQKPLTVGVKPVSVILQIILAGLSIAKSFFQWFREQSIADVAARAERAKVIEAEGKARDAMDKVRPVTADNLVERLRDGNF